MWDLIILVPDHCLFLYKIVLEHPIQHTKFQGHRLFGSGEDLFLSFFPYMGMAAILVMRLEPFDHTFVPPSKKSSI